MSIGSFVEASFSELTNGRYDVALALACSAIDATSRKTEGSQKNNNTRYKSFLRKNFRIITEFGFPGISAAGIKIKCTNIPDLTTDAEKMVSIEDIIYHTIRCGLIHQCEIDSNIEFTPNTFIGDFQNKFRLPSSIIIGLLMSVVLNESNSNEKVNSTALVNVNGKSTEVNNLWGMKGKYYGNV